MECCGGIQFLFLLHIATSCSHHCRHRSYLRIRGESQFCHHCALFSFALLTLLDPKLKVLAQPTVPVLQVLLTPTDVAPTAATALLVAVRSSGFFTHFRAPAIFSATTFLFAINAVTLEFSTGSPLLPLTAICRGGVLPCRHKRRVLLLP